VARIRAILRRTQPTQTGDVEASAARIEIGALLLDPERHEVRVGQHAVLLTHTEFSLLRVLMQRPEVVFERQTLLRDARAEDSHITERTVDTHIRRIRAKLREHGLSPVVTVHGVGYKLVRAACSLD
jgi:two-component system OmpR family response regulator